MILSYKITLDELSISGKKYNWPKHYCASCKRNMWGHGYVSRYFEERAGFLLLKRYRCPDCKTLVTVRPEGYWPRIRSSILSVYRALNSRLRSGQWPSLLSRQRGNHWLKKFTRFALMESQADLSFFLDHCHHKELQFLT
jgi:hypothetical protein